MTGKDLPHHCRGLAVKGGSADAVINDFCIYNTRLWNYQGASNNTYKNVTMEGTAESFTGEIVITDNSNNNTFINTTIKAGYIQFNDFVGSTDSYNVVGSSGAERSIRTARRCHATHPADYAWEHPAC